MIHLHLVDREERIGQFGIEIEIEMVPNRTPRLFDCILILFSRAGQSATRGADHGRIDVRRTVLRIVELPLDRFRFILRRRD